jgi:hypothetical protein
MNADDEGFVSSPKRISRSIGCSGDDIKILIAKQFVVSFESGVIVIKEWNKHNQLRKDRFTPTLHTEEKELLQVIDIKQLQPNGNQTPTTGKPSRVELSEEESSTISKDYNTVDKETPIGAVECEQELFIEPVGEVDPSQTQREIDFEAFWVAYGRKGNKKRSKELFGKLTDHQVDKIRCNLPAYLISTQENIKYRKDAQVYLNNKNEHWNDFVFAEEKKNEPTTSLW